MTDDRLRALERQFRETGAAEDEVAWLRQRVRVGDSFNWHLYCRLKELCPEAAAQHLQTRSRLGCMEAGMLELAARLGHEPARQALGDVGLVSSISEIRDYGQEAVVRAVVAGARFLLGPWEAAFPQDARPVRVVEAFERWFLSRSPLDLEAMSLHADHWPDCAQRARESELPVAGSVEVSFHLCNVALGFANEDDAYRWAILSSEIRLIGWPEGISRALAAELLPWGLGYGDPVRDRLEALNRDE